MIYPFFIFWFVHILRRTLFLCYFFQLKEYRLDRALEEFERKKEIVFSKYFYLGIVFLFLCFISPLFATILYVLLFSYSVYLLYDKRWQLPVFTKKMILWLGLIILLEVVLFFAFISVFFVLILEILFPLFIFSSLLIIQFFVNLAKKRIIQKAKSKRKDLDIKVIGITGSFAKTSAKEILYKLLEKKYKVVKTSNHVNTEMGVARTVLNELDNDVDYFICEMGAYKIGEIKAICDIIKPDIGVLTGINEQHLALFGSLENIIKGKYELIESLPEHGLAVFNGENKHCLKLFEKTDKKKLKYNFVQDMKVGKQGSKFVVDGVQFETKLLGRHNVLNILGAVKLAVELGVSLQECAKVVGNIERGGMVLKGRIIDSSYSSNPDGAISSLEYLSLFEGKKAIITPGLIELGSASKEVHQRIEKKILEVCDIAITTTKGVFDKVEFIQDPEEIAERLEKVDVILLEGRLPKGIIKSLIDD